MDATLLTSTIIFSLLAGALIFLMGYTKGKNDILYECDACSSTFKSKHMYDWHLISFCETQCMDEECPYREELGWEHSVKHHENPL